MKEMIIGYDAKRAFNNKTGLGNYSRMIISHFAMAHRDCDCILYTPTIDENLRDYFKGIANISTRLPHGLASLMQSQWRSRGVSFQARRDEVDIYHGLSHELPHGLPKEVKKVVTMHDLVAWRYPQFFKKVDADIHQKKQRYACDVADVVIAISQQTKQDLIDIMHVPEEKIRVVYQSCDDIFWLPIEDDNMAYVKKKYHLPERYLICVGTIEDRKNQLSVVRAMRKLPEDVKLVLVGRTRGQYGDDLISEIRSTGMAGRIMLLDNADFVDFPCLYAHSLGTVYMSLFEGFGIPILESLSAGVPVLTSNCSSMPEAGGDAAIYADPNNVDEIADGMMRLINDDVLRKDLIAKGQEQLKKFTPDNIVKEYYDIYASLMLK